MSAHVLAKRFTVPVTQSMLQEQQHMGRDEKQSPVLTKSSTTA